MRIIVNEDGVGEAYPCFQIRMMYRVSKCAPTQSEDSIHQNPKETSLTLPKKASHLQPRHPKVVGSQFR